MLASRVAKQLLGVNTRDIREAIAARATSIAARDPTSTLEHWLPLLDGVTFPPFLWTPPPVFEVAAGSGGTGGNRRRFFVIGDFGAGSSEEQAVAASVSMLHRQSAFDFGTTVGDNFYPLGIEAGLDDPRWSQEWHALYGKLEVPVFATLGNHDWAGIDGAAAEVLRTRVDSTWRLPAPFYTFRSGAAQLFAVDTVYLTEFGLRWLESELARSTAQWKIVYGHYPIYSTGKYETAFPAMRDKLLPILQGRAHLYIAGHDHNLQVLRPEGGVHFVIAGGGGADVSAVNAESPRAEFVASKYGFGVFEYDERRLSATLYDLDGRLLYRVDIGSE